MRIRILNTNAMKNFNDEINCSQPVLVDFYAKWCGPCKMMHPVLDEIEKQMKNQVKIIKIDVDAHPQLALEWRIQSVPTLMIFKDGDLKWRRSGAHKAKDLIAELEKWI